MKYIVRTVDFDERRADNVRLLKEQLPELEIVVDTTRNAYNGLFLACEMANEAGAVILEDDVLLCKDFKRRIEEVIAEKGADKVINFFEKPKVYFPTSYVGGSGFLWMQCTYFPPNFPRKVIDHYEQFHKERPNDWKGQAVDCLVAYALTKEKMKYWRIRPCLVQHLDFPSAIGRRPTNRQTPYFIDDLEAKGVEYNDLQPTK